MLEKQLGIELLVFSRPLSEMLHQEKRKTLKMLLDMLDMILPENTAQKGKFRKLLLDEINGTFRLFEGLLDDIAKRKSEQVGVKSPQSI